MRTNKIMAMLMTAVLSTFATIAQADESQKILIDDFSADRCGFSRGGEYPRAKGGKSLSKTEFVSAPSAMCVDYDFSGGGAYVGFGKKVNISKSVKALSFQAKLTGKNTILIRIRDSSGQTHQLHQTHLKSINKWQDILVRLDKKTFSHHWAGAKDGKIHWPIKHIFIGVNTAENKNGKLYIDDLRQAAPKKELPDHLFNKFVPPNKKFGEAVGLQAPFTQYTKLADGGPWFVDLGIKWAREDMNAYSIEPSPGMYQFNDRFGNASGVPTMHERFQFYADNNIHVIVVVGGVNTRAYPKEQGEGGVYPVEAYGDYALAVAKQLETYGNDFIIEIMNEPVNFMRGALNKAGNKQGGGNQQGGSPSGDVAAWMKRYVAMANNAIQKIKAYNPKIKVIAGESAIWAISNYWMVQAGIDSRMDGFIIHPYWKPFPGKGNNYNVPYWKMINDDQSRRSNIQRTGYEFEKKFGHRVPPYSTEVGFSDMTVGGGGAHDKQKPEVIAAYLPREFITEFAAGVEVIQWFVLKSPSAKFGDPFGLVSMKGHEKRKAYFSMKTMVKQLADYKMIDQIAGRESTVAGTQAYLFKNDANNYKLVIWDIMNDSKDINETKTVKIGLNTANPDKVKLYDIYGKELKTSFDNKGNLQLKIGISPIYIDGVGRKVELKKQ